MFVSYEYAWLSVKCTYRTCGILLNILPFALYTSPLSVYNGTLVNWTVVRLTATNFKPLIFSVSGIALSCTPLQSSLVNCCWSSPAQSFVGTHYHIFVVSRMLHGLIWVCSCLTKEGSDYYWSLFLYLGVTLPALTLSHSLVPPVLNYYSSLQSAGTDHRENVFFIACYFIAEETCPQNCSLVMAVLLSPIYTAVTWHNIVTC
jgi:hypothetical protein